jgi:hypothetical protein
MNIQSQIINILTCTNNKEPIIIDNSIIDTVDFRFKEYLCNVSIKNCNINNLLLHTSWFKSGFLIENCIISNKINNDYSMSYLN